MKLQLEGLEERTVPSATSETFSQMAQTAMQRVATLVEERAELIVAVEHNFANFLDAYTQNIVQKATSAVLEVDRILGIAPPPTGTGSGSGSGSANPVHNGSNQAIKPIPQKSGSGSGSGSATGHDNPTKPLSRVHPMGSGSGPTPEVYFGSGSNPFPEPAPCGSSYATRNVILSEVTNHTVTVNYETVDGTATAGTDYTYTSGTLTIPAGELTASQPIKIPILDDGDDENIGTEYFHVQLVSAQGAGIGTPYISEVDITEGPQQKPTDTLYWNPCMDNNASEVTNWYDWTQGFQLQKGALGPNPSSPVVFDGTPSIQTPNDDSPIDWDKSFTVASMAIMEGYIDQQTFVAGEKLELIGPNGPALMMDGNSDLKFNFDDHNQLIQIDNNAAINNMDVTGYSDDTIFINAGSTMIAGGNYTENLGVSLIVNSGATLSDKGQCMLNLTASDQVISVNGEMDLSFGTGEGITLIGSAANTSNYIYVDGGTLKYLGSGNISDDTINVPILNDGTFSLESATGQPEGGKLTVRDQSNYVFSNGSQYSVYMPDAADSVLLSEEGWLKCSNGYYQAEGTLVTDKTRCNLQAGDKNLPGTVTIAGGVVMIDNVQKTYAVLNVIATNMIFSGELDVSIDASKPKEAGYSDVLDVSGNINLNNNPTLKVFVNNGPPAPNQGPWTIIQVDLGSKINGDFAKPISTVPKTNLTAKVDGTSYILSS